MPVQHDLDARQRGRRLAVDQDLQQRAVQPPFRVAPDSKTGALVVGCPIARKPADLVAVPLVDCRRQSGVRKK